MDIEFLGRVLVRLKPFVRDHVIRRTRLERVLGALPVPAAETRPHVERLLTKANIVIDEDSAPELTPHSGALQAFTDGNPDPGIESNKVSSRCEDDAAVRVARRRLELDRQITNHAKVMLRADEEIGLAILLRGPAGAPLEQGGFARLTGEARQAAECLLLHNQGLVHSVAQRYAPPGMDYEDMIQHGIIGLLRAVELFDPSLGNKFSTYAMNWVHQSITRGMANESRLIRLPVHMVERVRKVWLARARLTVDNETPAVHHLALVCGLSTDQIHECLILGPQDVSSLDSPVGGDGETTLGDLLDFSDPNLDPYKQVEFEILQWDLNDVLDTLSEREAGVISMRFGLVDDTPKTLDQIGRVYGVTRERIRQIEKIAMDKLRHPSRSEVLQPHMFGGGVKPKPYLQEGASTS